jgi:uncharacterized membrane protein YraQ (UPF0718 family)
MSQFAPVVTIFLSLFLTSFPFLLLGSAVSSFLAVFVSDRQLAPLFLRNRVLGAIAGSLLGFWFSVSLYGAIPIARRFFWRGVPLAVVFSFLVSASALNIVTYELTWRAFPYSSIWFYRALWALITAIGIGILFSYARETPPKTEPIPAVSVPRETSDRELSGDLVGDYKIGFPSWPSRFSLLSSFLALFTREVLEFGGWLVLGCAIAALFQIGLPRLDLLAWGRTPFAGILVQTLFGFTLSVNSLLSALVPGSLVTTISPGASLAYLSLSSLLPVQGIGLLLAAFKPKIVFYFAVLILLSSLFAALIFGFYIE